MKTFKDNAGRTWSVAINVDAVKRIKARVGVDLLMVGVSDARLAAELAEDPIKLVDVLFAAMEPEAVANGVTDVEFGRAMGGDAIDDATAALMEEVVDFFPKGRRSVLRAALAKMEAGRAAAFGRATAAIEAIDVEAVISGGTSTGSPASPASLPAH
jgi:hypothetical protein